jgi:hypothetical protein
LPKIDVVHTLEARNLRRQRAMEEKKQEFEEDVHRRKTGLRHNEQLRTQMKAMKQVITTMSVVSGGCSGCSGCMVA